MSQSRYILLVLLATSMAQPAVRADDFMLQSAKTELPSGDRQFAGGDAEAINNNCLACHSAGMVLNQPRFSRDTWSGEVRRMIDVYKAPIGDTDAAQIVDYLAAHYGLPTR